MLFAVKRIPLIIDGQHDESCALKLVAEGDDAVKEAESGTGKVSKKMAEAIDILNRMYDEFEVNIGLGKIPHVEIKHWRQECLDSGVYKRTDVFNRAMDSLKERKLIFFDENNHFVYTDLKYRKYFGNKSFFDETVV